MDTCRDLIKIYARDSLYSTCLKANDWTKQIKYGMHAVFLKADFQSSHVAPRSSLRVMHEHFHPITMLNR